MWVKYLIGWIKMKITRSVLRIQMGEKLQMNRFPCPWQVSPCVKKKVWVARRLHPAMAVAAPQAAKPERQSHYLPRRTPTCLTDSPTEELKDTQDNVWQTDSLVGYGSVCVECLKQRQHYVESQPRLTLSVGQRSTSCLGVRSWLTKHSSLFGLALMDFDDRTDTGITWKALPSRLSKTSHWHARTGCMTCNRKKENIQNYRS